MFGCKLMLTDLIPTVLAADSFVILADLRAVIPYCRRRFGDGISGEVVSQRAHKPLDALVAGRKAKLIDQVLVNRLRISLQADLFLIHARCSSQASGPGCWYPSLPTPQKAGGRGGERRTAASSAIRPSRRRSTPLSSKVTRANTSLSGPADQPMGAPLKARRHLPPAMGDQGVNAPSRPDRAFP